MGYNQEVDVSVARQGTLYFEMRKDLRDDLARLTFGTPESRAGLGAQSKSAILLAE